MPNGRDYPTATDELDAYNTDSWPRGPIWFCSHGCEYRPPVSRSSHAPQSLRKTPFKYSATVSVRPSPAISGGRSWFTWLSSIWSSSP